MEKKQILFRLFKGEGFPSPFPLGDESFRLFDWKEDDRFSSERVHNPLVKLDAFPFGSVRNLFEGVDNLTRAGKGAGGRCEGFDLAKLKVLFHFLIYYRLGDTQILFLFFFRLFKGEGFPSPPLSPVAQGLTLAIFEKMPFKRRNFKGIPLFFFFTIDTHTLCVAKLGGFRIQPSEFVFFVLRPVIEFFFVHVLVYHTQRDTQIILCIFF